MTEMISLCTASDATHVPFFTVKVGVRYVL